ncbi:uncharacterized protein J8A68_004246 [[Candida] subhashii]|uniref:F-actin-capping protein subunit alpha n=1 Tax=[Candida] subhashii TaxID=561895 RepID=A0A8J5UKR3_9ASCO|nr:uncharacterized protein J8A68_004246 [[Candida] subhashii]KAG7662236.1 hypothetical protein J8A68_004246 [[Candida] subhashii]
MSVKLNELVDSLVKTSPPGELTNVNNNLSSLIDDSSVIQDSIESYVNENNAVFSGKYIAGKYNKHPNSSKYIDYVNGKLFNIDLKSMQAIDIEPYHETSGLPGYFNELTRKLEKYGDDHYPSSYAFTVIPENDDDSLRIIIIGQRLNNDNYYTGQWKSEYLIKGNGQVSGVVKLDIHYYEDGNVRLKFDEKIESTTLQTVNAGEIVNFINNSETKITLNIIDQFTHLNQQSFKNLRRLLPITRSKINWGNAIGNYRLGSDVVNKK